MKKKVQPNIKSLVAIGVTLLSCFLWVNRIESQLFRLQQQYQLCQKSLNVKPEESAGLQRERVWTGCRLSIFVFTFKRLDGLRRLLDSLNNAHYNGENDIALNLFIDFPKKSHAAKASTNRGDDGTRNFVSSFRWRHGPLRIHRRMQNAGLKRSIMEAWYPTQDDECGAFFEDDIEVSPYWYAWAQAGIKQYMGHHERLLGISLYRPIYDELSKNTCTVDNDFSAFALQQPCSWGAVYFPAPWRQFREWYDEFVLVEGDEDKKGRKITVQVTTADGHHPSSNTWASSSSWKKYLIKLMSDHGWFMVYPNLPDRMVYATNHLMQGEHKTPPRELFELPLLTQAKAAQYGFLQSNGEVDFDKMQQTLPDKLSSLQTFDVLFRRVEGGVDALPGHNVPVENVK